MNGKQLTVVLAIFSALIGAAMYGIDNRPIVGYALNAQELSNDIYYSDAAKQFSLGAYNSGKTDAPLILHFLCENATIANETKKPYNNINNSEVFIWFTVNKDNRQYYFGEKVAVKINKNIESFSCRYEVIKNTGDHSVSGIINNIFGEIKGFYPTYFTFKKSGDKFVYIT